MERVAIVARLKEGTEQQAAELIQQGVPFDLEGRRFERHAVYLSDSEIVFLFEGPEVEWLVDNLIENPVFWQAPTALERWASLIDGAPGIARERFFWERGQDAVGREDD